MELIKYIVKFSTQRNLSRQCSQGNYGKLITRPYIKHINNELIHDQHTLYKLCTHSKWFFVSMFNELMIKLSLPEL